MNKYLLLTIILLVLINTVSADSTTRLYPRQGVSMSPDQPFRIYQFNLTANTTGWIDYTTDTLTGKIYAIDWYTETAMGGAQNNTVRINATTPYVREITMLNLTDYAATTTYPRPTLDNVSPMYTFCAPLRFQMDNGTADLVATIVMYLEI